MGYLGAFSGIAFLIVGIVQMVVGYLGIEYHLGTVAAFVAIFIALRRFKLAYVEASLSF